MPRKTPPDWLLALVLLAGVYLWQRTSLPLWMTDLLPIQIAAYQWQHGDVEWIYAPEDRYPQWHAHTKSIADTLGGEGFGNPYFLPPFVAGLLSPFSEARATTWRNVLFTINFSLIFVIARIVLCLCRIEVKLRPFLWALALVLVSFPMSRTTNLGQTVPLLAAGSWMGLLWLRDRKSWPAGAMLGLVSAVKLFPIGLIALPAIQRRFITVAVWLGTFVTIYGLSILTLGPRIHEYFWQSARQFGTLVYPFFGNQSLIGWYTRLFRHHDLMDIVPFTDPGVEIVHRVIIAVVAGTTLIWIWLHRRAIDEHSFPAFAGLLMSGLLLSLANAWDHYWLFVLPVIGWAIHDEWTHDRSLLRVLWVLGAGFLCLMKLTHFYSDDWLGRIITGYQTVGLLMLWVWLLWRIREFAFSDSLKEIESLEIHVRS
jgi:hypothetical protein